MAILATRKRVPIVRTVGCSHTMVWPLSWRSRASPPGYLVDARSWRYHWAGAGGMGRAISVAIIHLPWSLTHSTIIRNGFGVPD
jgi:hypothetical protein